MTDEQIISQASEKQLNVACDATDATKFVLDDASVIEALECCSMGSYPACRECPYHNDYANRDCINKRNADIKDLINRQKAEIERLHRETMQTIDSIRKLFVDTIKAEKNQGNKRVCGEVEKKSYHKRR